LTIIIKNNKAIRIAESKKNMISDQTAYWLLSTLVQAMAAIWAIFFGLFIALRGMMINLKEKYEKKPKGKRYILTIESKHFLY